MDNPIKEQGHRGTEKANLGVHKIVTGSSGNDRSGNSAVTVINLLIKNIIWEG